MAQNITYPSSNPKLDEFVPSFSDQEIVEIIDGFEDPSRADSALMIKLYTTTHTTQHTLHNTHYTIHTIYTPHNPQCTKHNEINTQYTMHNNAHFTSCNNTES